MSDIFLDCIPVIKKSTLRPWAFFGVEIERGGEGGEYTHMHMCTS
jgi:hypothetical protein